MFPQQGWEQHLFVSVKNVVRDYFDLINGDCMFSPKIHDFTTPGYLATFLEPGMVLLLMS